MDESAPAQNADARSIVAVFISYATADREEALSVCNALERRGTPCWISCRDVAPGENYQEAIVCALRSARAMVLIFSGTANTSEEIKKELSLASRFQVPVRALRLEAVEPSDAFAYELSTRQWIDAFTGRDQAIDLLARSISDPAGPRPARLPAPAVVSDRRPPRSRILMLAGVALGVVLLIVSGIWVARRPAPGPAHSMVVRLSEFRNLTPDLPSNMPDLVREEIIAAFGDDGVIRLSTASTPTAGKEPAYTLGGTIQRDENHIRVITRLLNERSGATLWTDTFDYEGKDATHVPRRIAVDAGNMVHCGLFAASTYPKALPDAVMSDYMQFCQNSWWSQSFSNPEKALDAARKVAAAAPDFSWGWSAITVAAHLTFYASEPGAHREDIRRIGLAAADQALKLDPKNSEALAQKSMLIGRSHWFEQERLLKQAIAARPLFCGCEHYLYGVLLNNVGRFAESVREMRRSTEMLALDGISQFGLAETLLVTGKPDEATPHFRAAIDLFRDPGTASYIDANYAPETGDYATGRQALSDPRLHMSKAKRAAILAAFQAIEAGDSAAKARAAELLIALPRNELNSLVTRLLGTLGAHRAALSIIERRASQEDFAAVSWLWYPSMRPALNDPSVKALVGQLGLVKYWRATHTKPDTCAVKDQPEFCAMI